MADELVFYTHPMSRGRTVHWMLEEVGKPYQIKLLEYGSTMKEPEYLAINPMGKVPAICHNGKVVTESAAICAYLADVFPEAGLAPAPTSPERGTYYRWLFFAAGPLESGIINQTLGLKITEEQKITVGYNDIDQMLDALELTLQGKYLLGDQFSAADVYIGSFLYWMTFTDTIKKRLVFERYTERVLSRPAAIRANQVNDDLLQ